MHCINYVREQEKTLLFKLTLRSRFTLSQAHSLLSQAISQVTSSAGFEHNILCTIKFTDALYRRFRTSATHVSFRETGTVVCHKSAHKGKGISIRKAAYFTLITLITVVTLITDNF